MESIMSMCGIWQRSRRTHATVKILAAAFTLALALLSDSAYALTQRKNGVVWTYDTEDGRSVILSVPMSTKGAVTVPPKLGGFPVVGVLDIGSTSYSGWLGFALCDKITSITFPSSLLYISENAFYGCRNLKSVTFTGSVEWIGPDAFGECSRLKKIVFQGDKPSISPWAFSGLNGWCTIYVPKRKYRENESWGKLTIPGTWEGLPIRYLPTYTITFNANGGKGKMAKQTLKYSQTAKLRKNAFKRKGYVFIGWAKSKKGAVAYKNAQKVKELVPTGSTLTLYAKWAKKNYKVAFYANGGKGKMAVEKFTYGKAKKLSANKFKAPTGYSFAGWAKSAKGSVVYKNGQTVKNLVTNGGTVKLYAVWGAHTYTVAFNANGGTGTMAAQKMTYGKSSGLRGNAFKRTGYIFMGWAKTKTGAVAYRNGHSVKNLASTAGATVTLYAVWWKPRPYVVIDLSKGSGASSYPVSYLNAPPTGGFNTEEYKTTKLVLKQITATLLMGIFEVTQKQWELVMGSNPSEFKGGSYPVHGVTGDPRSALHINVQNGFIERLRVRTGLNILRLPTETEWQFACRAGATGAFCKLADGTEITAATLGEVAWYAGNSNSMPHPVGQKKPNAFGLYDMHGNVCELTSTMDAGDPLIYGGYWQMSEYYCTATSNWPYYLDFEIVSVSGDSSLGFRLAL